ncbi:MAG: hypothetical protein WAM39_27295 [Bryobacteraceae bacterium]
MATAADRLSLAEFQVKYGHSDQAYEYWHGEAIPKGMPTWIHGFLQGLLLKLLDASGYKSGGDVELRISPGCPSPPRRDCHKGQDGDPVPDQSS